MAFRLDCYGSRAPHASAAVVLGILLHKGHTRTSENIPIPLARVIMIICIIAATEIIAGILFLYYIPETFNSSFTRFAEEWRL